MTRSSLGRVGGSLLGVVVFLFALGLWETWARLEGSWLVPPATTVAERALHVWPSSEYLSAVSTSLQRLAAGLVLGAAAGISIGLLMGSAHRVRRTLEPLTEFLRAIPPVAVIPVAVVLLGLEERTHITVIAFGVSFPVLVSAVDGVRAVSPEARDTAAMLRLGPVGRVFRVLLPAALPSIASGLRIALSLGIAIVVVTEFVLGGEGVGAYIRLQQSQFDIASMYAGILFLGLLGFVLNTLFLLGERHVLAWHQGAAGATPH